MIFALFGHGRFGSAFADLLQSAGHTVRIHDPHAEVPAALACPTPAAALAGAEWVVLAMPVPRMEAALRELRPLLDARHTVIDVGSVKEHPCSLLDEYLGDAVPHAGTHPLFGPLSLARGEPLRVVLCASARHPQAAERTQALFESLGCAVIPQDAATHDRAMAKTHALAFFIARALVEMGVGDDLSMAPPSFLGLANMLAAVRGDAGHLFAAIQRENPYAEAARAELLEHLDAVHRRLLASDDALAIPPPAS
ncbi:prephenate dehydrogenase/arogenate dehydrogenase family protein [Rhodanobacter sp. PCA2]|uniref:prephenate dehydrogenase/arogenate dehydrogenase family protein n=1 Tax=Rhodanobacter sp. PCA2 TaxID=2006117 RepID=UPI0015E732C7|nr:prephenate dehydrogenase/arogenate dehydrogenase family protein [Rhodanobacter sp. PCA2]MBA2078278.1 prephenate dehydrogenase [Rhodanobacter sp. PCA2]